MKENSKALIIGFLKGRIPSLVMIIIASAFLSFFRMYGTTYIKPITDTIESGSTIGLDRLIFLACLYQVLFYVLRFAVSYLAGRLNQLFSVHLRMKLYAHLNAISFGDFEKRQAGDLQSLIRNDSQNASKLIHIVLSRITMNLFIIIVSSAYMWKLDRTSTAIILIISLGLGTVNYLIAKRVKKFAFAARNSFGKLSDTAARCCVVLDTIKLYGAARYVRSFFEEQRDAYNSHRLRQVRISSAGEVLKSLAYNLTIFSCAVILGFKVLDGGASIGTVLVFISLLFQVSVGFTTIFGWMPAIAVAAAALDRVEEILEIPESEKEDPKPEMTDFNVLELCDVNFAFESGPPLLKDISVSFRRGRSYQITGESGSGKTTLLKILLGLYKADGAKIRLDGTAGAKPSIGYVPSDTGIFNVSLGENIAMGDESITLGKMETAARELGALDWIQSLPRGFGHKISENGKNLSGGQKQMIALMRVLVRDYPVIVLDEPFSALDSSRESDLITAMDRIKQDKILIYTSHRESTAKAADEIVSLA